MSGICMQEGPSVASESQLKNRHNLMNQWLEAQGRPKLAERGFCNGDAALWAIYKHHDQGFYERVSNVISQMSPQGMSDIESKNKEYAAYQLKVRNYEKAQREYDALENKDGYARPAVPIEPENLDLLEEAHQVYSEMQIYFGAILGLNQPRNVLPGKHQGDYVDVYNALFGTDLVKEDPVPDGMALQEQFKMGFKFDRKEDIRRILSTLEETMEQNGTKHDKVIMLKGKNHTVSLHYNAENNTYDYYNPAKGKIEKGLSEEEVAQKIEDDYGNTPQGMSIRVIDHEKNELGEVNKKELVEDMQLGLLNRKGMRGELDLDNDNQLPNEDLTDYVLAAAKAGDLETIKAILDNLDEAQCKAILNKHGESGMTPLYGAAKNNRAEIIEYLAEKGADMNMGRKTPDYENLSPLLAAAMYSHNEEAISMLARKGTDVDQAVDTVGNNWPNHEQIKARMKKPTQMVNGMESLQQGLDVDFRISSALSTVLREIMIKGPVSLAELTEKFNAAVEGSSWEDDLKAAFNEATAHLRQDNLELVGNPDQNVEEDNVLGQQPQALLLADNNAAPQARQKAEQKRPIDRVKSSAQELTKEQKQLYNDNFRADFDGALNRALETAMSKHSGKLSSTEKRLKAAYRVTEFAYQGAKQELLDLKAQRPDPINPDDPIEGVILVAEERFKKAEQARELVLYAQNLHHAKTKFSDTQIKARTDELVGADPNESQTALKDNMSKLLKSVKADRDFRGNQAGQDIHRRFLKDKTADFTVRMTDTKDGGQTIAGSFKFDRDDLLHFPRKGHIASKRKIKADNDHRRAGVHRDLKHEMHDFMSIAIANGKGNPDNPIHFTLHSPETFELPVQAIIDLKTRAIAEGREFTMAIPKEFRKQDEFGRLIVPAEYKAPFDGPECKDGTFQLGPGTLSPQEAALFDHFATQKSKNNLGKEAKYNAGHNIMQPGKHMEFNQDAKPSENLSNSLEGLVKKYDDTFKNDMKEGAAIVQESAPKQKARQKAQNS